MTDTNKLRRLALDGDLYAIQELLDRLEAAEKERDALSTKIEQMEQQEPVAWTTKLALEYGASRLGFQVSGVNMWGENGVPLYALPVAQNVPNLADAYQGAMEEVAIWKKRALEAEDLNRKFISEINGPTHMGEPVQNVPSAPDVWLPVPEKHPTFDPVDLQLSDGSVLCGCVPQSDGDYWWEGPSGEVFIDPKYSSVTHWRLAAAPEAKS